MSMSKSGAIRAVEEVREVSSEIKDLQAKKVLLKFFIRALRNLEGIDRDMLSVFNRFPVLKGNRDKKRRLTQSLKREEQLSMKKLR